MLVRFAVSNFSSFKKTAEFSMVAGKAPWHSGHILFCHDIRLLKGSFIFGADAGDLIRSAAFAKSIVLNGIENTDCSRKYFRSVVRPAIFQFDIFAGSHFYSYGFALEYASTSFVEEWLYQIDDPDEEVCVFLRSRNGSSLQFTDGFFVSEAEVPDSTLFLSDPDGLECQAFRDVMNWFEQLVIVFPSEVLNFVPGCEKNDFRNSVVLIDGFERLTHSPDRLYSLTGQVIAVSQDTSLIDLKLLRQDEIWFVDKKFRLYSLNRFRINFEERLEKDYLQGRFGAVPVFRSL